MRKSFSSETKRQLAETELKKKCCRYIYNAVADFAAGGGGTLDGIYGKCRCEACPAAFLRALFVAYGSVTDPAKAYHLDLSFPDPGTRDEAHSIVQEAGFEFGRSVRRQGGRERYIIYTKNSSVIEDFLAYTGASSAVFAIMNSKIMGELRNSANRVVNCDTANIEKQIAASKPYIEAVNYLDETGRLETLPAELRMTAKLRRENPSLSLSELGDQMNPPVSKSGIRNRLNRILGITAEYRKKDENGAGELPG